MLTHIRTAAESYSPDSNRFDLQPFLRPQLTIAWEKIEAELEIIEGSVETLISPTAKGAR